MTTRGLGLAPLLILAACNRGADANDQAGAAANAAAGEESDVGKAERLVRERLGNAQGVTFADPIRTASQDIGIVCGRYTHDGATHRYVVVAREDVFLEPEMEEGEMERGYAEFCREGTGNRPAPAAPSTPQGNKQ